MHGNSFIISFPFFLSREPAGSIDRNALRASFRDTIELVIRENSKKFRLDHDTNAIKNSSRSKVFAGYLYNNVRMHIIKHDTSGISLDSPTYDISNNFKSMHELHRVWFSSRYVALSLQIAISNCNIYLHELNTPNYYIIALCGYISYEYVTFHAFQNFINVDYLFYRQISK